MTTKLPPNFILMTPELYHEQYEPLLIGMLLSFCFFGIGLTQFYQVWKLMKALWDRGERDWFHIICLSVLLVADLADTVSKGFFLDVFTTKIITGGLGSVIIAPKSIFSLLFTPAWIACWTQVIYCRRIIKLQSRIRTNMLWIYLMMGATMLLSLGTFAAAMITGYIAMTYPQANWIPRMIPSASVELGGSAFVDVLLCVVFVWSLRTQMSDFKKTNDIVAKWIFFTLETNLLTSVLQIVELILFLLYDDTSYHEAIILVLPKIYINSILVLTGTVFSNKLRYLDEDNETGTSKGMDQTKLGQRTGALATNQFGARSVGVVGGITVNIEKTYNSDDLELPEVKKGSDDHMSYGRAYV